MAWTWRQWSHLLEDVSIIKADLKAVRRDMALGAEVAEQTVLRGMDDALAALQTVQQQIEHQYEAIQQGRQGSRVDVRVRDV